MRNRRQAGRERSVAEDGAGRLLAFDTYFDNNYRKQWEDNLRMFQSKHPRDSKYMSEAYKYRSRIFRPKSRSVVRKNEATAALAFFSNPTWSASTRSTSRTRRRRGPRS
jgi:hypothetical protein